MSEPDDKPRIRPGRPRSRATHQAILDAAADLIERGDYKAVSIDRIAQEAHVGKQSIYRWWSGKAELVLEAFTERVWQRVGTPAPSGDAFQDLEAFLASLFDVIGSPPVARGLRTLIAEAQIDDAFRDKFYDVFVRRRRKAMRDIVRAGIAAGQIRGGIAEDAALDLIYGGFWYRLLSGTPHANDATFAREVVGLMRRALAAGEGEAGGPPFPSDDAPPLFEA